MTRASAKSGIALLLMLAALTAPARAELRDVPARPHTIALGPIADPDTFGVVPPSGASPGDAGAFTAHADADRAALTQQMITEELHLGAELHAALAEALLGTGAKVVPPGQKGAELTLSAAFVPHTVGYSDALANGPLMPGFVVVVFVTNVRDGSIVKNLRILYGRGREVDTDSHALEADARYRFDTAALLFADPKSAALGLRAGVALVAADIAREMSR